MYINDITLGVQSSMRMFADDCIVYRAINCESDRGAVQDDLDKINTWCKKWQMQLNLEKTMCMTFSRKKDEASPSYTVNKKVLKIVSEYRYLGVFFHANSVLAPSC